MATKFMQWSYYLYNNHKALSKRRELPAPHYSLMELREWLLTEPLWEELWKAYEVSGWDRHLAPSCDRRNNSEGYSFDNVVLTTSRLNNLKGLKPEGALSYINQAKAIKGP